MGIRYKKRKKLGRSVIFFLFVSFCLASSIMVNAQTTGEKKDPDPALLKSAVDYD